MTRASDTAAPRPVRIPLRQLELAALDYGNRDAPPMLLVHGMRDLAWSLDPVARAFRDRYRVVSVDLRGHGDSDKPGWYALPHFVSDLHATCGHLGLEHPVLVGHSFGGEVASQLAGTFPDLPRACVLVEGLGPPPWEGEGSEEIKRSMARRSVEMLESTATHRRPLPDLDAAVTRLREAHPGLDGGRLRLLAEVGTRPHPDGGICWKWDPMLVAVFGSFGRDQIEERWRWIECPVLVVTGSESGTWWAKGPPGTDLRRSATRAYLPPGELDRRLSQFRDARCVEIEGAGHMVHFDQPDRLNAEIAAFLDDLGG